MTLTVTYDPTTATTTVDDGDTLTTSPEPYGPAGARLTAELYRLMGDEVTLIGADQ